MQSGYTGHIVPAEWRWVIFVSILFVLVAFAPFVWITLSDTPAAGWQFMGAIHNYQDAAAYLSKILQGQHSGILVNFQHTPEPHQAVFLNAVYPLLGQASGLISISTVLIFHIARVGSGLIMCMAIYQMAASIWMRVRTRRLFFVFAIVGGGLGWLFASLTSNIHFADLAMPEAFPFQSMLMNVHFPLGLACLALLASIIIMAFRPGAHEDPALRNGGVLAAALSVVLALIYPEAVVIFALVLGLYCISLFIQQKRVVSWALGWLLVVVLPTIPILGLYGAFLTYNPAMQEWYSQRITPAADPLGLVLGLGIPLIIALPGLYRALRRFERDGDQFMLIWIIVIVVAIYLPMNFQRRFAAGLMLPIAYFSARSLEDFWFLKIQRRWRYRVMATIIPLMFFSHVLVLFSPIAPVIGGRPEKASGLLLQRDYFTAFQWLAGRTRPTDVILAAPNVGTWLPAWVNARVVYGHPEQTLGAALKKQAVIDWYQAEGSDNCTALLEGAYSFMGEYKVRYVIVGPQENALGAVGCVANLTRVFVYGSITIYAA